MLPLALLVAAAAMKDWSKEAAMIEKVREHATISGMRDEDGRQREPEQQVGVALAGGEDGQRGDPVDPTPGPREEVALIAGGPDADAEQLELEAEQKQADLDVAVKRNELEQEELKAQRKKEEADMDVALKKKEFEHEELKAEKKQAERQEKKIEEMTEKLKDAARQEKKTEERGKRIQPEEKRRVGMRDEDKRRKKNKEPEKPPRRATYRVSWQFDWTRAQTGKNGAKQPGNAHFTEPVLATHRRPKNAFFRAGMRASNGVRDLCEFGSTTVLTAEIECASKSSNPVVAPDGTDGPRETLNMTIVVDRNRPYLTGLSMIAPSPDWCVGGTVNLLGPSGLWLEEVALDLTPYDAGTRTQEALELFGPTEKKRQRVGPLAAGAYKQFFNSQPLGRLVVERVAEASVPKKERPKGCGRKKKR